MSKKREYCIKIYSNSRRHEMYVKFLITGGLTLVKSRKDMSISNDPRALAKKYMDTSKPDKEIDEYDFKNPVIVEVEVVREEIGETDLSYYLEH